MTVNPDACNVRITSLQLEPSAQAPWTSTTFGLSLMHKIVRADPVASHESTDSFLNRPPGRQTRLAVGRVRGSPAWEIFDTDGRRWVAGGGRGRAQGRLRRRMGGSE